VHQMQREQRVSQPDHRVYLYNPMSMRPH
jgi:hypothetical protein